MSILNKYKKPIMNLFVVRDRYYDFVLSRNEGSGIDVNGSLTTDCLSAYIDMSDPECFDSINTVSKTTYHWDGAVASGVTLYNIGFTGMDNGFLRFDKDTITDFEFYRRLTRSEYSIDDNDYRLILRPVDGNTKAYSYEMCKNDGFISLKGGFLQGFYKLFGHDYQVLPNVIRDSIHLEFVLRPRNYTTRKNILNSFYPENRGIFFYMGTRAENKFAKMYGTDLSMYPDRSLSAETDCHSYFFDDYFNYEDVLCEPIRTITDDDGNYFLDDYLSLDEWLNSRTDLNSGETFSIVPSAVTDNNGQPIFGSQIGEITTDNKYLFFNRLKDGFTVKTWDDDNVVTLTYDKRKVNANLFLLMNRTKTGLTVNDMEKLLSGEYSYDLSTDSIIYNESGETYNNSYDLLSDIYNNAFALKLNDDGSVGYRYFVRDCDSETGYSLLEEYSYPNMVKDDEWNVINIRIRMLDGNVDECENQTPNRKMKLFFYVNGYLKFVSKELPAFNFKELSDVKERQEAVPYNISLGGGTQGLAESIWIKYKEMFPKVLLLEQYFAGTFIGDIRSFKFYSCPLEYNQIKNNYLYEKSLRIGII